MSNALTQFGASVRHCRLKAGFSQEELALRTKLHRTYIGGIERGERNPTLLTMIKIANALTVPISDLVHFADDSE